MTARFAKCFIVILCVSAISVSQTSGSLNGANIAEIFLARADAEGKAGDAASSFLVTDIPIFCVVRFTAPVVADVKMDLVAASVPGVKAESKVVSVSYTTKETEDRVNFSGRPNGNWVPGTYRVDVFIAGKKVRTIAFDIKSSTTETLNPTTVKPRVPVRKTLKRTTVAKRTADR